MKKAYVVGIDEYLNHPLSGCVNDANVVSELLSHNADGSPNFDVKKGINLKKKFEALNIETEIISFPRHQEEFSGELVDKFLYEGLRFNDDEYKEVREGKILPEIFDAIVEYARRFDK